MNQICQICRKTFYSRPSHVAQGWGKFCSKPCSNIGKRKPFNIKCSWCNAPFHATPDRIKKAKTGFLFCCPEHQNLAKRIHDGIPEFKPSNYSDGRYAYRELAFSNFDPKCKNCGYNKIIEVLEVHHKDRNRSNNALSNLEILCPTCHLEHHFVEKTGIFTP